MTKELFGYLKYVQLLHIRVNATNVVEVVNDKHNATIEIPSEESDKAKAEHVIEQIPAGHVAEEQQQSDSMKIFFILIVLGKLSVLFSYV